MSFAMDMENDLIQFGWFRSNSGMQLPWKVDCDALSDGAIDSLARLIAGKFSFGWVYGIPRGGLRLANALLWHTTPGYPLLIVDDVLTTGGSMERARESAYERTPRVGRTIGVVIFARGPTADWIWPIFQVSEWTQSRGTGLG